MALGDYLDIDDEDVEVTAEERSEAVDTSYENFRDEHGGQTYQEYYEEQGFGDGVTQQGSDRGYNVLGEEADALAQAAARERTQREKYGLTGDKIYEEPKNLRLLLQENKKPRGSSMSSRSLNF